MKRIERRRFRRTCGIGLAAVAAAAIVLFASGIGRTDAQTSGPTMLVPNLSVRPAATGFITPIGLAFLPDGRWLVLEKNTGQVQVVSNGTVQGTAIDLAVNNTSERGLLGIALHPNFAANGFVYLFWSCKAPPPPPENPFFPTLTECADTPELGADTNPDPAPTNPDLLAAPLLGNRVDRFVWDDTTSTLSFDSNLIKLRSFQNDGAPVPAGQGDEEQPPRGNHDGGIIRFGPDGKLYIMFGDVGRRGQLQNLPSGPTLTGLGPTVPDDQFGGPEPDDAHFSGVDHPLERRRDDSRGQPVLLGGRRDGRRSRREHPEDLRLRDPQQLRDGVRSRYPETSGTRRTARTPSTSST